MDKKAKLAKKLQILKEHSNKFKEYTPNYSDFEDYEEAIEDDDDDLEYLEVLINLLNEEYADFLINCNINNAEQLIYQYMSDEQKIVLPEQPTFIETPEWLKIKNVQSIHKMLKIINVFNILSSFVYTKKK